MRGTSLLLCTGKEGCWTTLFPFILYFLSGFVLTLDLIHFQCEPELLTSRSSAAAVWSVGKVEQFEDQV